MVNYQTFRSPNKQITHYTMVNDQVWSLIIVVNVFVRGTESLVVDHSG
jgi:hypothetical protein